MHFNLRWKMPLGTLIKVAMGEKCLCKIGILSIFVLHDQILNLYQNVKICIEIKVFQ